MYKAAFPEIVYDLISFDTCNLLAKCYEENILFKD